MSANEATILSVQRVADLIRDGLAPKDAFSRVATASGVKPAAIAQRYYTLTRSGVVEKPPVATNGHRVASTLSDRLEDLSALVLVLAGEVKALERDAELGRRARAIMAADG